MTTNPGSNIEVLLDKVAAQGGWTSADRDALIENVRRSIRLSEDKTQPCSANTRVKHISPRGNKQRLLHRDIRCNRQCGHAGLHRHVEDGYVYEWNDTMSFYPTYSLVGEMLP